ncbi:MAG: molybdenum cofactor guanylyltransferase [Syntrophobacterales bacterium]|nr:molybdenum cofactor guanylyltransferase [Syntrophobacterales bacterium]
MSAPPVTGIILAGGLGRRLGQDKATLPFRGRPLALHVAAALRPWAHEVWLLTNQPLGHAALGLPLMLDLRPFQGPLGGLLTALTFSPTPWVLAAAVDCPLLQPALLEALCRGAGATPRPAVVSESARGLEALPGLFHVRLRPRLEEYLARGERRLRPFITACRPEVLPREETRRLDPGGLSFVNVNTPAEVAAARRLAGSGV